MSADYSMIDNYLKRSNLFYNMTNDLAQSIYEEHEESGVKTDDDWEDKFFNTMLDDEISGFMDCEAEDYINSYGMFKALQQYNSEYGCLPSTPHALLYHIAYDVVKGRFMGLMANARRPLVAQ